VARPPTPLPEPLLAGPFGIARAVELGVGRGRLRHRGLIVPTRGVRTLTSPRTVADHARAQALVLSRPFAFSHLTAAALLGMPLPRRVDQPTEVHVMTTTTRGQARRSGVVGHRGVERRSVVEVGGLPVVGPVDTWADLAGSVPPDELVVLGDWLLGQGLRLEQLAQVVHHRETMRGVRSLRAALRLVRPGSASRMETLARLMFVRGGLPEPELNADVHDLNGQWILRADFLWRARRVLAEYQGDIHRTDRQRWQSDVARRRLAEQNGWTVIELTSRELFQGPAREELLDHLRTLLG